MKPIKIPVYYHTDASIELERLGVDSDDFVLRDFYFYQINAVNERNDGDTNINSGGEIYTTPMRVQEVLKLIETNNK
jgi:hypothetical protein